MSTNRTDLRVDADDAISHSETKVVKAIVIPVEVMQIPCIGQLLNQGHGKTQYAPRCGGHRTKQQQLGSQLTVAANPRSHTQKRCHETSRRCPPLIEGEIGNFYSSNRSHLPENAGSTRDNRCEPNNCAAADGRIAGGRGRRGEAIVETATRGTWVPSMDTTPQICCFPD